MSNDNYLIKILKWIGIGVYLVFAFIMSCLASILVIVVSVISFAIPFVFALGVFLLFIFVLFELWKVVF